MSALVVFDLDGTLLDSLGDLAQACNHALALHGLPGHEKETYKRFVGDGVRKLVERMTPNEVHTPALLDQIQADYEAYYAAHMEDLTAPYAGVPELLEAVAARGGKMAVLSNKPHVFTLPICERFFGEQFSVVHGQREGYPRKPDASLVHEILELTATPVEKCIYVGDSGVDMQTAKNAGVFAVGVLWGFRERAELESCGADALVKHPMEILEYLPV